ncbi:MAG: hypothetical protein HC880_00685 [Bacteroidia bacterium]|nr:hypothetical protein [Bacteroidia bacterium]
MEDSVLKNKIYELMRSEFEMDGFEILSVSDRHYQNRIVNGKYSIFDVQIGYKTYNQVTGATKYKNIENYTIIFDT